MGRERYGGPPRQDATEDPSDSDGDEVSDVFQEASRRKGRQNAMMRYSLLGASALVVAGVIIAVVASGCMSSSSTHNELAPVKADVFADLGSTLKGKIEPIPSNWDGFDNGWSYQNEAKYFYTQPPGMFPAELASYVVTVENVDDIKKTVKYAAERNLTVSVKGNGHSYAGSALGGQLLIYMGHMNDVKPMKGRRYCGIEHDSNEVGGGTTFSKIYKTLGDNFTTVGGACPTVNGGGGWILGNGMSNEVLPMYGLGVDNVLQYDVVLANGEFVEANSCTNPDLFKALRGGGGGFGVTVAVHYQLYPPSPLQRYRWTTCDEHSSDLDNPEVPKRWNLFTRWVGRWDWRWSTKYISGAGIYTFLGTHEEAIATPFYQDATRVFGEPGHDSYPSLIAFKLGDGASGFDYDCSINKSTLRQLGPKFVGNYYIPLKYMIEQPDEARDMFMTEMAKGGLCPYHGEYFMVGKNNQVLQGSDPTSLHPAARRAAWQASICSQEFMDKLMKMFPDSGVGINHAPAYLENFEELIWGPQYANLQVVKKRYDPKNMFRGQQQVDSSSYNLKKSTE